MRKVLSIAILLGLTALLYHCRPERNYIEDNDAILEFSVDTVYFDTIFTTIGTTTKSFTVVNPYSRFIKIEDIKLAGGSESVFRINVDGIPGTEFSNYEIAPKDSMYVFVEATLDPNGDPNILRIQDSITFSVNGNLQDVDLVAWGQDVHLLRDSILDYSTTWTNEKPYLIIGGILIDSLQTLVIEEGVKIYMHRDAVMLVKGSLQINGSLESPVSILGDRLEYDYRDIPGQWGYIFFLNGSEQNSINYAEIKNGTIGLLVNSPMYGEEPVLRLQNTEINQMSYDGILAQGTTIVASNTVIGDCGNSSIELLYEGAFIFTHCTIYNNWNTGFSNRKTPAVFVANFLPISNTEIITSNIVQADFRNCIISGSRAHEISISKAEGGELNYFFDHCLTKIDLEKYDYTQDPKFFSILNNEPVLFDTIPGSYQLDSLSPAINKGGLDYALQYPLDKKGDYRTEDGLPDLGAYERISE